jgi:tRNA pseudouridine38-40 synthase
MTLRRIALAVEYDGSTYAGWQIQPNGTSVQQVLQERSTAVFGVPVSIAGSGRTDAGVHARCQVAHADVYNGHDIPESTVAKALNAGLPHSIRVRAAKDVAASFHARFSAIYREYVYVVNLQGNILTVNWQWQPHGSVDIDLLHAAATAFVRRADFTPFSKMNPSTRSYICDVTVCRVERSDTMILIRIGADRFVYGMCRAIVGTLMDVARQRRSLTSIDDAFEHGNRLGQSTLAPAHGLILNRIKYPDHIFDHLPCF